MISRLKRSSLRAGVDDSSGVGGGMRKRCGEQNRNGLEFLLGCE